MFGLDLAKWRHLARNRSSSKCGLDYLMTEQIIAGDVDEVMRWLKKSVISCISLAASQLPGTSP